MNAAAGRPPQSGQRQLVLAFPLNSRCRFDDFVVGPNVEVVSALSELGQATDPFRALLTGPRGAGKSHLLQAACHRFGALPGGAIYLPLGDPELDPAALEGLEQCALVALDDVAAWLGDPERERALLALYQGLIARSSVLLVAAEQGPAELTGCFPDLISRLRALPAYALRPPDDSGKAAVLRRLAAARGLELSRGVLDYWLGRGGRDLGALIEQFETLDAAAMAAQRRVTIPLLKEVLGL